MHRSFAPKVRWESSIHWSFAPKVAWESSIHCSDDWRLRRKSASHSWLQFSFFEFAIASRKRSSSESSRATADLIWFLSYVTFNIETIHVASTFSSVTSCMLQRVGRNKNLNQTYLHAMQMQSAKPWSTAQPAHAHLVPLWVCQLFWFATCF